MKEAFLHYLWQNQLVDLSQLILNHEPVEIIHPGWPNNDAGPDFFNIRIKLDGTIWAGNAEIHVKSSDWQHHGHQNDPAYDNVILHLVVDHDQEINNSKGMPVPTVRMHYDSALWKRYEYLLNAKSWIPCQDDIHIIPPQKIRFWLYKLAVERIEQKAGEMSRFLEISTMNWEELLYVFLGRYFGAPANTLPFEILTRNLSFNLVSKNKDDLLMIEAMLFGQAGFLDGQNEDPYFIALKKEYLFARRKYGLIPADKGMWKFSKMRPAHFPSIRIGQFASLLAHREHLFSNIIEAESKEQIEQLFDIKASEYWDEHYNFGKKSKRKTTKVIGDQLINILIINVVIPLWVLYGQKHDEQSFIDRALGVLEELNPEKNNIIRKWKEIGVEASSALDSQALLQLKKKYCDYKRCLDCKIGNLIIADFS